MVVLRERMSQEDLLLDIPMSRSKNLNVSWFETHYNHNGSQNRRYSQSTLIRIMFCRLPVISLLFVKIAPVVFRISIYGLRKWWCHSFCAQFPDRAESFCLPMPSISTQTNILSKVMRYIVLYLIIRDYNYK